jgi:translocator protein
MHDRSQSPNPNPDTPDDRIDAAADADIDDMDAGDALESDQPHQSLAPDVDAGVTRIELEPAREVRRDAPARDAGVGSPTHPRSYVSRDSSWFWPLVNLVGLVAVVLINWLANWVPFNDLTTGEIADRHPVPFQPAGWAFTIWGVIYVMLLVFVIYGFLPAGRNNPRVQAVGPFFLVANLANIAWIFLWHWEQFTGALIAMVVLLASLVGIYAVIRRRGRDTAEPSVIHRLIVWTPFSVYLGWISIAMLANIQVWMTTGGWDGGPFGLRAWAVIFLLAGVLVAAAVGFFFHDAAYAAVFVWGYLGIAQEQWSLARLVSVTAIGLVVVVAAVTVMAFMLAFDRRTMPGGPFGFRRRGSPAPPTGV